MKPLVFMKFGRRKSEGVATDAKINQLFPDPNNPVNNRFGKVVDVLYKYGSIREFLEFTY